MEVAEIIILSIMGATALFFSIYSCVLLRRLCAQKRDGKAEEIEKLKSKLFNSRQMQAYYRIKYEKSNEVLNALWKYGCMVKKDEDIKIVIPKEQTEDYRKIYSWLMNDYEEEEE